MINVPDRIKDMLHEDTCPKNIRIHFPNGERADICNDMIVKDSVSFKESLCSQNIIKFGLCEASVFECETVGVGNIKGATIEVYYEIYGNPQEPFLEDVLVWKLDIQQWVYPIPCGIFVVSEAKRQSDMQHRKIVAYNGQAYNDWKSISRKEKVKGNVGLSSKTNYTPNLIYFLESNGIHFADELYDLTNVPFSDNGTESWEVSGLASVYKLVVAINTKYYSSLESWSSASEADALYVFNATQNNIKSLVETIICSQDFDQFFDNSIYHKTRKETIEYIVNLLKFQYKLSADGTTLAGLWRQINDPMPLYFYPYANGLNTSYMTYFILPVSAEIRIVNYNNVIVESFPVTLVADTPTITKKTLKTDFLDYRLLYKRKKYGNKYRVFWTSTDLLKLLQGWLEINGMFGYFERGDKVKLINIKRQFGLLPANDLYPNEDLYPEGVTGGQIVPNDYQSCWYEDEYLKPYGAVQCSYTNTNDDEIIYTLYLVGYDQDTDLSEYNVYELDNDLINDKKWTEAQIQSICQKVANNISGVTYMPVELKGRGLPYVEAGDTFEILTKNNESITTIVLNRTLTGEMTLFDTYKSV